VSAVNFACVKYSDGIICHVSQRIWHAANRQSEQAAKGASYDGRRLVVEKGAEANVSVVHKNNAETSLSESRDERLWPTNKLHS
jgi:hypothetical protein